MENIKSGECELEDMASGEGGGGFRVCDHSVSVVLC